MLLKERVQRAIQELKDLTKEEAKYVQDPIELEMREKLTEEKIVKLESLRDEFLGKYPRTMSLLDSSIIVVRKRYEAWFYVQVSGQGSIAFTNVLMALLERNLKDPSKIPLTLAKPNVDKSTKAILAYALYKEQL